MAADSPTEPEYRVVNVKDEDEEDPASTDTTCSKCVSKTLHYLGYLLLIADIGCIVFLITLLYEPWFKYLREYASGYTSQPDREVYAENCDFTWENVSSGLNIFILWHFIINMVLALAIRNRLYCWIAGIMWEILEFTYANVAIFNYAYNRECWWDIIILDILIFNAIGIEIGLFLLKYVMKYALYPEWSIPFRVICGNCQWRMKYVVIIINLLFLWAFAQLPLFAFYEYTFWLSSDHWLAIFRTSIMGFSAIPAFAKLYEWMFMDVDCCSKSSFVNHYWIIMLWSMVVLELVLTLRHYLD